LGFDKWLPKPAGVADCAQTMVNSILQQYETARMEPIPIFLECAAWLKTNAPVAPCVSLCKGTNGLGEEIFNGGRIVAMSDWEEALIGDPSSDFAFTQGLIPEITRDGQHLWGLQPALAFYESKSGIKIDPLSVRYYGVVRALKLVLFAVKSARSVHEMPLQSELRQAWTAIEVGNVGKRLLAAAMGWGNPPAAHILEELNQSVEQVA
jgi:aminoglycoside phosphotransferase (APT) family kinase protein